MTSHTRSLLTIALGHLTIELCSNFLPVVYPVLISTLGLSYTQIGFVALVASTGTSLAQPLFGYLSDRWNPQRISALSIAWIGVLMGLVGFTWDYPSLVLLIALGYPRIKPQPPGRRPLVEACFAERWGCSYDG